MTDVEMTDAQVAAQIARADSFRERLRDAITATPTDSASLCADEHRIGLRRISETLHAVPFVVFCNLANLDAAMRGMLLEVIEVYLLAVGSGPALDYPDASAFLAGFEAMIEKARKRRLQ